MKSNLINPLFAADTGHDQPHTLRLFNALNKILVYDLIVLGIYFVMVCEILKRRLYDLKLCVNIIFYFQIPIFLYSLLCLFAPF